MKAEDLVQKQRAFFESGRTLAVDFRIQRLKQLKSAIQAAEGDILAALQQDLGKSAFEGYAHEVGFVLAEIGYTVRHLRRWARPKRVRTPITQFWSASTIHAQPYGVALVISPWNYPFQLTLGPVIGAIAAGNCVVVKPSELAPATSSIIEKLIGGCLDAAHVKVVTGDAETTTALLQQRFDSIFFTGSVAVGKVVMQAAAKALTPVTLELGGKSPCFVDETANLRLAAKRIAWGKFINAGQTCVAPDYVMVHRTAKAKLIQYIQENIARFYGQRPCECSDYGRIVSDKHVARLGRLMQEGHILYGGAVDEAQQRIEPTLIDGVSWDSAIMQEEIFGPLLPILEFDDLKAAIREVNAREKPLAAYLFTTNMENERHFLSHLSFGGGCVNDTVVHLASSHLPFGGVGESGMGGYHGKHSFDTFTHPKSVLKKSNHLDIPLRYPPYQGKLGLLKRIMK